MTDEKKLPPVVLGVRSVYDEVQLRKNNVCECGGVKLPDGLLEKLLKEHDNLRQDCQEAQKQWSLWANSAIDLAEHCSQLTQQLEGAKK